VNLKELDCQGLKQIDSGNTDNLDIYHTKWKGIDIIFHVAVLLNSTSRLRLIKNDICHVVFYEDQGMQPFKTDCINLTTLGALPQIFAIVKPQDGQYRLAFFQRQNPKYPPYSFAPHEPPSNHNFDISHLKDYLFTKLHNGQIATKEHTPIQTVHLKSRTDIIKQIGITAEING